MKAIIIKDLDKNPIFIAKVEEVTELDFLKIKKECEINLTKIKDENGIEHADLRDEIAKLKNEIKILKGED